MIALLQKEPIVNESLLIGIVVTEGLRPYEFTALIAVMVNSVGSYGIAMYALKEEMQRNGYSDGAISLAITKLLRKGMIEEVTLDEDYNNYSYSAYKITKLGED